VNCGRRAAANAVRLWHDEHILSLAHAIAEAIADILKLEALFLRGSGPIRAENWFFADNSPSGSV